MPTPPVPVFDLDGTLIDSDDALVRPFLDLGVPPSEIGFGHPIVEECARLGISLDDYVAAYDTDVVRPFPGVDELVARLGVWALCSNKDERSGRAELRRLDWHPDVAMFAGDFGGRSKRLGPVLDALGIVADRALFVGDTDHDRRCAGDVGAAFAWAGWNRRVSRGAPEGTVLSAPGDLVAVLGLDLDLD